MPGLSSQLARQHLDQDLAPLHSSMPALPADGWIRTIRLALGMSTTDLARRLGVSQQTASQYELAEQAGTIKVATLRTVARALGCELEYALVPEQPLAEAVLERAREVARRELAKVDHSMALEQQLPAGGNESEIDVRAAQLIDSRRLWTNM